MMKKRAEPMNMKQEKPHLFLKLDGEKISSSAFKKAIDHFFSFVDKLSIQLSDKNRPARWIISVKKGSICLGLHPESTTEQTIGFPGLIKEIETGINQISKKDERPSYYSNEVLSDLNALAKLPMQKNSGIKGIYIIPNGNEMEVSSSMKTNIDSILKIQREEFGSFEGTLKIISIVQGLHFQIYEFVHDHAIKCLMDEKILGEALRAFNKRVYVFGLIRYSKGGIPSEIQVKDLRVLRDENELPTANEVLGILKDIN
jgi:hypothetical protein